jgi:hypothetical protein
MVHPNPIRVAGRALIGHDVVDSTVDPTATVTSEGEL